MSDTAIPLQDPSSAATEFQALQFMIVQRLRQVQTAILVAVEAVHGGGIGPVGTVDVLPLVDQVDGAGNAVPHATIYGRPYLRLQGGANAVVLDPQPGDLGLMVFCSRDISSVIASRQHGPPASGRIFDYADGLYVGGCLNGIPQQYVAFAADGIHVVSPQAVSLTAPSITLSGSSGITLSGPVNANGARISTAGEVTDALGKVLGTHVHGGVQSGGSNTGPPA